MSKKTRKRRTIDQRIADQKARLQELEAKKKSSALEDALESGHVPDESVKEFKKLKRELKKLNDASKILNRHDCADEASGLQRISKMLVAKMHELVDLPDDDDEEEEDEDEDEYEEDDDQ